MSQSNTAVRSACLISAAVGASFAGAAHAGPVSTAPAGFTPVTIHGGYTVEHYRIDLDADGQDDLQVDGGLTISPTFQKVAVLTAPYYTAAFPIIGGAVEAFASPNDFIDISGLSGGSSYGDLGNFTAATPYGEISLLQNDADNGIGYIKGIADPDDGSFLLQDYGLIVVPEPASLALLAAGAVGLAAFRRRRAAAPSA